MSKESLGGVLLTLHNLRFYVQLMEEARAQIGRERSIVGLNRGFSNMDPSFRPIMRAKKKPSRLGFFFQREGGLYFEPLGLSSQRPWGLRPWGQCPSIRTRIL